MPLRIALSLLLFAGTGCTGSDDPAATPTQADVVASQSPATASTVVVQAAPDGETTLAVGQLLAIALEGNASTGYRWEIETDGAPQLALAPSPDGTDDAATDTSPPLVGSPSTQRWHFEAVQPGTTTLRLVYLRPWEKDVAPAQTAEFKVAVTAAR